MKALPLFLPCFLCGKKLEMGITKNGKPYFKCDHPCGTQIFVRRKPGIERLEELLQNIKKADLPFKQHAQNLYEMQAMLQEIDGVKEEIKKMSRFGGLFLDDEQVRTRNLLKARQENLFSQLEELSKKKT